MKLNYEQKFKERNPLDTIKIVKDFFSKYKFQVRELNLRQNSSSTWSVHLQLYIDNLLILTANGKGTSKDYCIASGYSELYERFCNKIYLISNNYLNNIVIEQNYKQNGFYYHPEEKIITFEDAFNFKAGQYYLEHMSDEPSELKGFFNYIFNNKFIGVPYKNIVNNRTLFLDPRVKLYLNNSSGMAAGNTFYEAFNQGMSEIYEHYVNGRYFSEEYYVYHSLKLENITNPLLQDIIQKIQRDNTLYIFDMSYNYNMPVLMSVIINKQTHATTMNFGAFPVFEIAVERVLTELYQGIETHDLVKTQGQIPSSFYPDKRLMDVYWPGCTMTRTIFPEYMITNMIMEESPSNIFLQGQYSNEEIYGYIQRLNKYLNFDVYYFDCSLSKDLYAINIFVSNIPYLLEDFSFADKIVDKTRHLQFLGNLYSLIENQNYGQIYSLLEDSKKYISHINRYYLSLLQNKKNQFLVSSGLASSQNILEFINILLYDESRILEDDFEISAFIQNYAPGIYPYFNLYLILRRYIDQIENYEISKLIAIFKFLELPLLNIDIQHINDKEYWIQRIFFNDIDNVNNGLYKNYITIMNTLNWTK